MLTRSDVSVQQIDMSCMYVLMGKDDGDLLDPSSCPKIHTIHVLLLNHQMLDTRVLLRFPSQLCFYHGEGCERQQQLLQPNQIFEGIMKQF